VDAEVESNPDRQLVILFVNCANDHFTCQIHTFVKITEPLVVDEEDAPSIAELLVHLADCGIANESN
jgi:hypothetical protein